MLNLKREKVVVAMSGGVDSSVAACLLVEQGYDVIGLFMRVGNPASPTVTDEKELDSAEACGTTPVSAVSTSRPHQGCCSASDATDARYVAGMLGIPFYALNFEQEFDALVDYFADEYARGRTPNPCVVCNDRFKFGRLVDYADAVEARFIATGHYARIAGHAGPNPGDDSARTKVRDSQRLASVLLRGVDARKDQSYVLFGLRRTILDRTMFPIGHLTKDEVRRIAARHNLPNQDKPDSVEICFVPDRNYARVVRDRRPDGFVPGEVLDQTGRVIGTHDGLANYTVGQRRGLRIAAGKPIYVTQLDVLNNRVVMGDALALTSSGLIADRVNLLADDLEDSFRAQVKIRYLHDPVPATVSLRSDRRVHVLFDEPQRAVTPGQAVVFYDGDMVLGGAWIDQALSALPEPVTAPSAAANC